MSSLTCLISGLSITSVSGFLLWIENLSVTMTRFVRCGISRRPRSVSALLTSWLPYKGKIKNGPLQEVVLRSKSSIIVNQIRLKCLQLRRILAGLCRVLASFSSNGGANTCRRNLNTSARDINFHICFNVRVAISVLQSQRRSGCGSV